jgi:hypothetical protein
MISIKKYNEINSNELEALNFFLKVRRNDILPYQTLPFIHLVDKVFGYNNLSLVAFKNNGSVCGFIPQWRNRRVIESVPWRDKGGAVFDSPMVLDALRTKTKQLMKKTGEKGIIWKDFCDAQFTNRPYYINVEIKLVGINKEAYWDSLSTKVRGKIRQARKKKLIFKIIESPDKNAIQTFYRVFVENRRRLGVPTYPLDLFKGYFKYFPNCNIKLFAILTDTKEVVAAMILLHNNRIAIDAYSAATGQGLHHRANDFMIFNVINYCIEKGIKKFDFGADSPLQRSLISYKRKWLGKPRLINSSIFGNVKEFDHNRKLYKYARSFLRLCPIWTYRIMSSLLVR